MSDAFRITSFWDVSRWGFLSGFALLLLLQLLAVSKHRERMIYGTAFVFSLIPFLLTNTRAPLLALVIISIGLILSDARIRKYAALLVFSLIVFAGTIPSYQERFASIFQVQIKGEKLVSTNQSNLGRLNMWKVAIDFFKEQPIFGTGFEKSSEPMRNFLQRQDPEYIKSYVSQEFSLSDQHSSYLTSLVQFGFLFTFLCLLIFSAIFVKTGLALVINKPYTARIALVGLTYCFIVFFFYSAFSSYEAALFFALLSLGVLTFSNEPKPSRADIL